MSNKKLTPEIIKAELSLGLNSINGIPRDRHEVFISEKEEAIIYFYQTFRIMADIDTIGLFVKSLAAYIKQSGCTDIFWRDEPEFEDNGKYFDSYFLRLRFSLGKNGEHYSI